MCLYTCVFFFLILEQDVMDALVYRCVLILGLRTGGGWCVGIQVCSYSLP